MKYLLIFSLTFFLFACGNDNSEAGAEVESPVNMPAHAMPDNAVPQVREALDEAPAVIDTSVEKEAEKAEEKAASAAEKQEEKAVKAVDKKEPEDKKTEPKKRRGAPEMTFESNRWNFGDIKDGDVVDHEFKFKNTGNAPLEIRNVTASCGCTQPSFPFMPIAPGEEGVIGVTFNSTGKINEQRPTVTVTANTKTPVTKLFLEGMVRPK